MSTTNTDTSVIDSRDLIEELDAYDGMDAAELAELDDDDHARAAAIRELSEVGIEDWEYGATLIHENYFTEYAQELAEDSGAIPQDTACPAPASTGSRPRPNCCRTTPRSRSRETPTTFDNHAAPTRRKQGATPSRRFLSFDRKDTKCRTKQ